jgi:hypothetical protein
MDETTLERQKLIEAVSILPDEALLELASFLEYLRYKSVQRREPNNNSASFLLAIAGSGNSGQQDVSERDEEILGNEIDPIYGWNLKLIFSPVTVSIFDEIKKDLGQYEQQLAQLYRDRSGDQIQPPIPTTIAAVS